MHRLFYCSPSTFSAVLTLACIVQCEKKDVSVRDASENMPVCLTAKKAYSKTIASLMFSLLYGDVLEIVQRVKKIQALQYFCIKIIGDIFSSVMKRCVLWQLIAKLLTHFTGFFFNIKRKSRCEESSFDSSKHVFYDHWDIFTKHWN